MKVFAMIEYRNQQNFVFCFHLLLFVFDGTELCVMPHITNLLQLSLTCDVSMSYMEAIKETT